MTTTCTYTDTAETIEGSFLRGLHPNDYNSDRRIDPLLLPFLRAPDEAQARQHLDHLIAQVSPSILRITRASRTPEDAFQEATHRVVRQLRELRAHCNGNAIGNYLHYVKVVASRVVKGQVRQENPRHRSLVDALRHVLRRETSLALWDGSGQHKFCGLAAWRDQREDRTHSERLRRLLDEPRCFQEISSSPCDPVRVSHADLLRSVFGWLGHPIRFDELIKIVSALRQTEDLKPVTDGEANRRLSEWLPDQRRRPDEEAEWRQFLERLWTQIEQLPHLQRLAYLLNFTAADGQVELFWTYGIVSIRGIGAVLRITEEQFARVWPALTLSEEMNERVRGCKDHDDRFAVLWQHLPLPDAVIARLLGTERQRVINLRKSAGDRLSRNMLHA